jgi:hypothetical protein
MACGSPSEAPPELVVWRSPASLRIGVERTLLGMVGCLPVAVGWSLWLLSGGRSAGDRPSGQHTLRQSRRRWAYRPSRASSTRAAGLRCTPALVAASRHGPRVLHEIDPFPYDQPPVLMPTPAAGSGSDALSSATHRVRRPLRAHREWASSCCRHERDMTDDADPQPRLESSCRVGGTY